MGQRPVRVEAPGRLIHYADAYVKSSDPTALGARCGCRGASLVASIATSMYCMSYAEYILHMYNCLFCRASMCVHVILTICAVDQ